MSETRARDIKPDYQQNLEPQQRVVVTAKKLANSKTIIINGSILVAVTLIQIIDVLTGANVIEPLVKIFTSDPDRVTNIITVISQAYTAINLYLRFVTNSPITLKR